MSEQVIFTLNVPTDLKDDVVDKLITFSNITGFNLIKINGYSKEHSQYDIGEQVEGYRAIYQIEVLIFLKDIEQLKASLNPICQPAKLKYWITPVIQSDHF